MALRLHLFIYNLVAYWEELGRKAAAMKMYIVNRQSCTPLYHSMANLATAILPLPTLGVGSE